MRNFTKLLILALLSFGFSNAQTARVQVIHNAADLAAATVDVYLNDVLLLNDFAFRTASPFVDAPAGTAITLKVAPANSTSAAQSIYSKTVTLTAGGTYIVVANGIVSTTGYTPSQAFDLIVNATAREEASQAANTDVLVFHGATDAPTVDVVAAGAGTIVNDASYGNFAGYLELPTADYTLSVTTADGATVVASYAAPLETLNLDGQALTVLASGFLNPANNSNGPAFGLWAALASGGNLVQLPAVASTARVQVIHNAADLAAATVDVYLNETLLLDNFAFRTASPFVDAPAGAEITLSVAPANSTSVDDSIFSADVTLEVGGKYIVVADGIVSATGYTPNQPFNLFVYPTAREEATQATNTDVLVFHGATDAPTVDVVAAGAGTLVNDASYGNFAGYLELPTADYTLSVTTADGATVVASYAAPLETLNLDGQALTVLASGFLNPANNSNGPAFGLWAALASGGNLVQLPVVASTARVQVIHNAADLAAATVDVYLNETLLLDNFAFRTASPFVDAPAGAEITLSVAPANSTSVDDSIFSTDVTLEIGGKYIVVADGIVSATGYTPNQPFNLFVYPAAREEATSATNTDVLVFHGATDAPTVDVVAAGAGTLVNDASYGNFAGYLELPTADYTLSVTTADGATVVASYAAPLETLNLDGQALTVLASGFLNPANNSNGPAFGLWAALASGGNLVQLPVVASTARVQVIHNAADLAAATVDVYLNETLLLDNFAFRTASPFVDAPAGAEITLSVAPANSTSVDDSIFSTDVTLEIGGKYIVVADGIVSATGYTPNQPFNLFVYPAAREEATSATNTDVLVFHGATDAPTVDVAAAGAGTLVNNTSYGDFTGYLELPTADYTLSVTTADGTTVVASYAAPLETLNLDGQAITVLASGFLNPANNSNGPAFGLWVALAAGGNVLQLPAVALSIKDFTATQLALYPNPASDIINISGADVDADISHAIFDSAGRKVLSASGSTINVSGLSNGIYIMQTTNYGKTSQEKLVVKK